jgi:hypothetical protein
MVPRTTPVFLALFATAASELGINHQRPTLEEYKDQKAQEAADDKHAKELEMRNEAVNKVIEMLDSLKEKVMSEGEREAASYQKFACFCKDTTTEKNEQITKGEDDKASLQADITSLSEHRDGLDGDIADYEEQISDSEADLKHIQGERRDRLAVYEKNAADLSGALESLDNAIDVLKSSKNPSLMQVQSVSKTLQTATFMADALGLPGVANAKKELGAFLQQPAVEMEDYKFHSNSVIESLENLKGDFRHTKQELDADETRDVAEFEAERQSLIDHIKAKELDLNKARAEKDRTTGEIAMATSELTTTSADLLDNQKYLGELAEMCQATAKTWDQRSEVRADELSALVSATAIIKDTVKEKTSKSTVRFAQQGVRVAIVKKMVKDPQAMEAIEAEVEASEGSPSFLQKRSVAVSKHSSSPVSDRFAMSTMLAEQGKKLRSTMLTSVAMHIKDPSDPFDKIKKLMQDLIEKLMQEAIEEANSKGFCDKAIGDSKHKRDLAVESITELNANMATLEATRDKMTEEITVLHEEIAALEDRRTEAEAQRETEEGINEDTVAEAEAGLTAVKEAIDILDHFYKSVSKDKVDLGLLQKKQPSKDAPSAGFDIGESYNAGQGESGGILGMLDVIKSDFERTIKVTTSTEKTQADEHTKFMGESGVSLFEKRTAIDLKIRAKDDAIEELEEDDDNLNSQTELLKVALQELVDLQPTCVQTGMTYEERVARREEEIQGLKIALCTMIEQEEKGRSAEAAAATCGTTPDAGVPR